MRPLSIDLYFRVKAGETVEVFMWQIGAAAVGWYVSCEDIALL